MRRQRTRLVFPCAATGALAAALLAGCQSTNVAPLTQANVQVETDERMILNRVRAEEQSLLRSGFVANLPEVDRYLDGIVQRLHPQPLPDGFRLHVRVVNDSTLNAFALPNGALFIHTGLLARLENEAQLATILAHEITHALNRHGLKSYRSMKNHTAFASAIYVGGGGSLVGLLGTLGALSSATGYSRDLEREADVVGFRLLTAAGYDPRASAQVFRILLDESISAKRKEPFFFGSHPRLAERSANFRELIEALPAERRDQGRSGVEEFTTILPPILHGNAHAALQAGDLDLARDSAKRALQLRANDAQALCLLAESFRRRTAPSDRTEAVRLYREALAADPALAEAHRGLGLELMKAGDHPAAATAFRRYLELAPTASDRGHVQEFIRQCENPSS